MTRTKVGPSFSLSDLAVKDKSLVSEPNFDIRSFTLTLSQSAGTKGGQRKGSFVASVTGLVDRFYEEVVQHLKSWIAPPLKVKPSEATELDGSSEKVAIDGERAAVADDLTSSPTPATVAEIVSVPSVGSESSSQDTR
jgi:hypothetical protein